MLQYCFSNISKMMLKKRSGLQKTYNQFFDDLV